MPFPQTSYQNQDAFLTVARAFGAAGATVTSASIDLQPEPALVGALSDVLIQTPALTTGEIASAQTITIRIHDSADNSSFANIPELESLTITGGGSGAGAGTRRMRLPPSVRRYIRLNMVTGAGAGDPSTKSGTIRILT